jgi:hypothetical protein
LRQAAAALETAAAGLARLLTEKHQESE